MSRSRRRVRGLQTSLSGLAGAALVLAPSASHAAEGPGAQDAAHPCRPTVSCTADLTAPGTLELEAGNQLTAARGRPRVATFPLQLKQTLATWVQLQAGSNGYTFVEPSPRARYVDNVVFGPKVHVHDQDGPWPSLAVSAELGLPTFVETGYARHDDAIVIGYASKDFGALHLDVNVGAIVWRLEGSPLPQPLAALALSTALSPLWSLALEGYAFADEAPVASRDGGVRAALGFTARPWLVVDAGGDAGFFPDMRAYTLFLGATVIPVVMWRP